MSAGEKRQRLKEHIKLFDEKIGGDLHNGYFK